MAKKPETVFKERLRKKLNIIPHSWFVKIQLIAICGIPDFLGVVNGRFVALELKKDANEKPKKLQMKVMHEISRAGGLAFVVFPDNHLEVLKVLQHLSSGEVHNASPEPPH